MSKPANQRCGTCRYFAPDTGGYGECHLRAPQASEDGRAAAWPLTYSDEWCGEWKAAAGRRKPRLAEAPHPEAVTMSIPEAGAHFYGLSKNGSYNAANRGDIPTIRVGRLRRVPVAKLMNMVAR